MSISRRGLIAAGIALAAVASVGVASTLNAGAAQIEPPPVMATTTGNPAPATTDNASTTAAPVPTGPAAEKPAARKPRTNVRRTPPGTLPWGAKPRTAKRAGTAGLAADGAVASGAENPGEVLEPEPAYEPKGRPAVGAVTKGIAVPKGIKAATGGTGGIVQALATTAAPTAKATEPVPSVNFFYSSAHQLGASDGTYATLTIGRPYLSKRDYHTLGEIAVRSADGRQTVEVGWTVDRDVNNGSAEPHLFVYHWVDNRESCYNGCGFVQYSPNVKPGDRLPVGAERRFAIQHFGSAWWIAYDNEWIGYYPDELWSGKYTRAGLTQWFGEVAASTLAPCTDMGNGLNPTVSANAATFSEVTFLNGPATKLTVPQPSPLYPLVTVPDNPTKFQFGGTGAC